MPAQKPKVNLATPLISSSPTVAANNPSNPAIRPLVIFPPDKLTVIVRAKIINEKTGLSTFIDLVPHINLIDNFHYARNISLPGSISDLYTVKFNVIPPTKQDLSLHKDWSDGYQKKLFDETSFTYKKVNFKEIAESSR